MTFTPLSPDALAAMWARCEAATSGAWQAIIHDCWCDDAEEGEEGYEPHPTPYTIIGPDIIDCDDFGFFAEADAKFIASSRVDLPTLLTAYDAALAEIERLRAESALAAKKGE